MSATPYVLFALCALAHGAIHHGSSMDGRIVGGESANIEDYPYQLSLMKFWSHRCGASIISAEWALTAAHCVDASLAITLSVRAGSTDRSKGGTEHQVVKIIQHESYSSYPVDYDFALIQIRPPFKLGQPGVQAVELTDKEPVLGEIATISGWGRLSEDGNSTNELRAVQVPIMDHAKCNSLYVEFGGLSERCFCAGLEQGGKDSCTGDSGGPLLVNGKQAGIVSWGYKCGDTNYPGVYANIANQREWIRKNSGI